MMFFFEFGAGYPCLLTGFLTAYFVSFAIVSHYIQYMRGKKCTPKENRSLYIHEKYQFYRSNPLKIMTTDLYTALTSRTPGPGSAISLCCIHLINCHQCSFKPYHPPYKPKRPQQRGVVHTRQEGPSYYSYPSPFALAPICF